MNKKDAKPMVSRLRPWFSTCSQVAARRRTARCPPCPESSIQVFENAGGTHASADAHRYQPILRIAALQLANDTGRELGAGTAQRMSKGDGSAVRIHLHRIQLTRFDDGKRLCGESLVQLDDIDLIQPESGDLQGFGNRVHRAD